MKICGIYKIVLLIKQERIYVGSAVNINRRWTMHLYDLKMNKHHSNKLQRHYNKYGKDDLQFIVIEECSKSDLLIREQHYIDSYSPYFNECKTAGSCLGRTPWNKNKKMSKEFSNKMKVVSNGNKNRIGCKHSVDSKNRISKSLTGKTKLTEKQKNDIRAKYIPRKYTANKLADEYNVCKDTILTILHS
jgi:group I intron endonuclease